MRQRTLIPFFILTFGITWGIASLYIFLPDFMSEMFGQLTGNHPLFFVATYSPAIAAIILVLAYHGVTGLRDFLGRLMLWRCARGWYAFLLIGVPLVFYAGFAVKGEPLDDWFPFESVSSYLLAACLMAFKGPLEEFGWRGIALPLLQRSMAPLWAALVLGAIWGVWHLPAFFLSGTPQGAWSFAPFLLGAIAISVIVTPMFNTSKGSLLLPMLFHFQLINPLWPDAQPYDTYILMVIAVWTIWHYRDSMFTTEGNIIAVVPVQTRSML